MELPTPNPESEAELRVRAIEQILREICRRFRESNESSFTTDH